MNAEHVPFLGSQQLQEFQVREPQGAVERKRVDDVTRVVSPSACPHILIEGLNRRARRRKNQPNSICADELILSEMRDNFPDTPFPRSRPPVELLC